MSFFASDDMGDGSIWDSGLGIFGQSNINKLLSSGSCKIEELLAEDDFIQETQGQSKVMLDFLSSPSGLHGLVRYVAVAQQPTNEKKAFQFPYVATEALCCRVPAILQALTSRTQLGHDTMLLLFSVVDPGLRSRIDGQYEVDTTEDQSQPPSAACQQDPFLAQQGHVATGKFEVRPYLAGYASKVIRMLCQTNPAAMIRFCDRTPGLCAALLTQLHSGSVADILASLLALPWAADGLCGMTDFCLARMDDVSVIDQLLSVMRSAIVACASTPSPSNAASSEEKRQAYGRSQVTHAAQHAADVLISALRAAVVAPHTKFGAEGYNAAKLAAVRAGPSAAAAAASDASAASVDCDAVLTDENLTLDPSYFSPHVASNDSLPLRLLKAFRDGESGPNLLALCSIAANVLQRSAGTSIGSSTQAACAAPLRVLQCILGLCGVQTMRACRGLHQVSQSIVDTVAHTPALLQALMQPSIQLDGDVPMYVLTSALDAILTPALEQVRGRLSDTPEAETRVPVLAGLVHVKKGKGRKKRTVVASSAQKGPQPADIGVAPAPSTAGASSLGLAGLALCQVMSELLRCGWPVHLAHVMRGKDTERAQAQTAPVGSLLLNSLMAFPWHSVLHRSVSHAVCEWLAAFPGTAHSQSAPAAVHAAVTDMVEGMQRHLLVECKLLSFLVASLRLSMAPSRIGQLSVQRRVRVGYTGAVLAMANGVLHAYTHEHLAHSLVGLVRAHGDWWTTVDGVVSVHAVARGILIGGQAPDVKSSGNVGTSADATGGAKTSVDEVSALEGDEDKLGEEGQGDDEEEDEEAGQGEEGLGEEEGEEEEAPEIDLR